VATLIKLSTALVISLELRAIMASATTTVVLSTSVFLLVQLLTGEVAAALIGESRLPSALIDLMITLAETTTGLLILSLAGSLIISSHLLSVISWCILELLWLVSFCVMTTHHAWERV